MENNNQTVRIDDRFRVNPSMTMTVQRSLIIAFLVFLVPTIDVIFGEKHFSSIRDW